MICCVLFCSVKVRAWTLTDEGKLLLKVCCKQRRLDLEEEIQLRDEIMLNNQVQLKQANDVKKKV